ncbi:unnamed protein product [Allacma fusca]|uniref:Uncharacterized protein n=1 Tax=Allacma fusca TaxID=39272 RepID=A0A8J2L4K1_9HEXA|nr:unnamed protein product [Allacma fusca]
MAAESCKSTRTALKGRITTLLKSMSKCPIDSIDQEDYATFSDKAQRLRTETTSNYTDFLAAHPDDEDNIQINYAEMQDRLDAVDEYLRDCRKLLSAQSRQEAEREAETRRLENEKARKEQLEMEERLENERIAQRIPSQPHPSRSTTETEATPVKATHL